MVQLEIPNLDGSERLTLNGSVRETYFGWLWVLLSAVDSSPGRIDAGQTESTDVIEKKFVKYDILLSEIYRF